MVYIVRLEPANPCIHFICFLKHLLSADFLIQKSVSYLYQPSLGLAMPRPFGPSRFGLACALWVWVSDPVSSHATTYYVDASLFDTHVASPIPDHTTYDPIQLRATGGQSLAYRSLADIDALVLQPGDSVLLRRGQSWSEELICDDPQVYYGNYGNGPLPILQGASGKPARGAGLIQINADGVVIDGLHSTQSGSYGIVVYPRTHQIVIKNSEVSYSYDGGIVLLGGYEGGSSYISQVAIHHNKVHHTNSAGFGARSEAITLENVRDFEVYGNHVSDGKEEGITIKYGSQQGKVYGNIVANNNGPNIYLDATHDLEVFNNRVSGSAKDKAGIGISVETTWNPSKINTFNLKIHHNVIYDNGMGLWIWFENGAQSFAKLSGIEILNNTITGNNKGSRGAFSIAGDASIAQFGEGNRLSNNLIFDNSYLIKDDLGIQSKFEVSNNLIEAGLASDFVHVTDILTTDPKFVDPSQRNYRLQGTSPGVDQGIDFGFSQDFDGTGIPYQQSPDIGAFEWNPNISPMDSKHPKLGLVTDLDAWWLKLPPTDKLWNLQLVNAQGQVLNAYPNVQNSIRIPFGGLPQGKYWLRGSSLSHSFETSLQRP
jgi:hypothetical protein